MLGLHAGDILHDGRHGVGIHSALKVEQEGDDCTNRYRQRCRLRVLEDKLTCRQLILERDVVLHVPRRRFTNLTDETGQQHVLGELLTLPHDVRCLLQRTVSDNLADLHTLRVRHVGVARVEVVIAERCQRSRGLVHPRQHNRVDAIGSAPHQPLLDGRLAHLDNAEAVHRMGRERIAQPLLGQVASGHDDAASR